MRDELPFNVNKGYHNSGNDIDLEEGTLISPSSNIIYNRDGKPTSVKNILESYIFGGSRSFVLDSDLVGFLGTNNTTGKAVGNILQGVGKSLWFVGNGVNNAVKAYDLSTNVQIGGTNQVETLTISGTVTGTYSTVITITGAYISGSPLLLNVYPPDTYTSSQVATWLEATLKDGFSGMQDFTSQYFITVSGSNLIFTDKYKRANDPTFSVSIDANPSGGISDVTSTNTTAGSVGSTANLSSTPQYAKWNGDGWDSPVQVGVPQIEDVPVTTSTTSSTISSGFSGIVTGSRSFRVARKRYGSVSIASPPSAVIELGSVGTSVLITIPPQDSDSSLLIDNSWLIYSTYAQLGSTFTHRLFPIEIPESELNGTEVPIARTFGNARALVISQHASSQASRIVEIEFYDRDLLLIEPFEDYYPLDSCKFLAKLGNVMCGIGTGDDNTGFDVSYPNNHEAYPPDWRDWFSETPVAISQEPEQGFFWICGANTTYIASWTGVTTNSAPVIINKISSRYGSIGEGAIVSIKGILYLLSKGKTPVRISPNGEIDDVFGTRVRNAFSSFDSTTQLGWDEETNSVVFVCGTSAIAYQIDKDVWSSPISLTATASFDSCFSINGHLYLCYYKSGSSSYTSNKYNSATTDLSWNLTTSFITGKAPLNLKDIIEFKGIFSGASKTDISVYACRDFNTGIYETLGSVSVPSGNSIPARKLIESNDYDTISARLTGTKGGQTVHLALFTIDLHEIERVRNHTTKINYDGTATLNTSTTVCSSNENRTSFYFRSLGAIFVLNFGGTASSTNILQVNPYEGILLDLSDPFDITQQINVWCATSSPFDAQADE